MLPPDGNILIRDPDVIARTNPGGYNPATEGAGMNPDDDVLVEVFEAEDEMEAMAIQSLLEGAGIEAAVRSRQIPMFDGVAKVYNPVWGHVLVLEGKLEEARELIAGYLDALDGDGE